jgi:hypothetical protein
MTAPLQLKWFRIEQDASGAILSCEEVEAKGRRGAHVRYYEAVDKAAACDAAKAWYERYLMRRREYARKRREDPAVRASAAASTSSRYQKLRAAGLCTSCGTNPLATQWRCTECHARQREAKRRRKDCLPPLPRKPGNVVSAERQRAQYEASNRLCHARVVSAWGSSGAHQISLFLRHFDSMSPAQFRTYLIGRITKLGGETAAKALAEYEAQRANQPKAKRRAA